MERYESLHHTKWECKYHLVWIPKYRKKVLYGQLKKELVPVLRELMSQKESEVIEGKMKVDHVHVVVSIPPKYSVVASSGICERKECDLGIKDSGAESKFLGSEFLGSWILRLNGRSG